MGDRPVYSTASGSQKKTKEKPSGWKRQDGPAKVRLETKGRGGKAVTVLFNLPWEEDEAKTIVRELKDRLGCGGTLKDGAIELMGDVRTKLEAHFDKRGIKLVRAGG